MAGIGGVVGPLRNRTSRLIFGSGPGKNCLGRLLTQASSLEIKQGVFRSRISPSLLGSRQGDRIPEMEGEERDVVLRFPAGGQAGPSRQPVKKCINELSYR